MKSCRLVLFFLACPFYLLASDKDTLVNGVNASFTYAQEIFPAEWQKAPISAKGSPIVSAEISRSKRVTVKALSKYPEDVLRNNLRAVYWMQSMSFYQVGYGGTNSTDALYLTNDGIAMGYTERYLEQTFHHEFSSILFRNYPSLFDTTAWKANNNSGFIYNDPEDGVGAIRNNASSQDLDTFYCRRGMLTEYALSSLENDLNTYAQNLFCPSPGFWAIVDRYPRVRRKATLLIAFYQKINGRYTEEYFRKLSVK